MNKLELLPTSIDYKENTFFLSVWVNAWGNLCIGYQKMDSHDVRDTILSYVVEKNKKEIFELLLSKHCFHPDCIEEWLKNQKACPYCKTEVKI